MIRDPPGPSHGDHVRPDHRFEEDVESARVGNAGPQAPTDGTSQERWLASSYVCLQADEGSGYSGGQHAVKAPEQTAF